MANDNTDPNGQSINEHKSKDLHKHRDLVYETSADTNHDKDTVKYSRYSRRGLIITASVLGLIAVGLIGAAVGVFVHNNRYVGSYRTGDYGMMGSSMRFESSGYGAGYGRYVTSDVTNDSVTTTVYNYQTGVVTAVNSDNIVIAGNGKSTTIKTNSSTKYTNDIKPAVNDSVTVVGTTANSTVTATEIDVLNK